MKKIFIYTAILATIATACSKIENETIQKGENPDSDVVMITEKVSANVNPSSKADIDADAKFTWSTGDQLAVHVSDGKYYTTTALVSGGSNTAEFSVTYPDGKSRDAFAIYPASIVAESAANYGQSGTSLDVTLPSSYTLAQVSGTTTPCPMIATNTPGSGWTFKQLCGLLRLTINGIPADATGMVIQFPGKKVNGAFSISAPVTTGTSTIATAAPADGEDKITVSFDAGLTSATVNLPLPTGDYEDVFITPVGSATKVAAVRHIKAGGYTAVKAHAKKLTTTMVSFSVSASKKVVFAPGNLWAIYKKSSNSWTWSFAPRQSDIIGYGPGNTLVNGDFKLSGDGTVDLFSFSTSTSYWGIRNTGSDGDYSGNVLRDWGSNVISGYSANTWFTLSKDEWKFVTGRDTYRNTGGTVAGVNNALCTRAVVNGVKGFIIFPDHYSGLTPSGVNWVLIQDGHYSNPDANEGWTSDKVSTVTTLEAWEALENEGCVFLPVAGMRLQYVLLYIEGGYGGYTEPHGMYASSTYKNDATTYCMRFNYDGYDPENYANRRYGLSVRLVHEL
ncbi:MAG: hypothetical protein IKW90_17545 [Lachnospiraceae bacterium]|nr:hypothetical protein [Lachnospiraceae bacterium]